MLGLDKTSILSQYQIGLFWYCKGWLLYYHSFTIYHLTATLQISTIFSSILSIFHHICIVLSWSCLDTQLMVCSLPMTSSIFLTVTETCSGYMATIWTQLAVWVLHSRPQTALQYIIYIYIYRNIKNFDTDIVSQADFSILSSPKPCPHYFIVTMSEASTAGTDKELSVAFQACPAITYWSTLISIVLCLVI